jgi:putative flippase GtrA
MLICLQSGRAAFRSAANTAIEKWMEFIKFVGARLFTMVVEVGGVWLLAVSLSTNELLAKCATQVIVLIVNYIISKSLVFKKEKMEEQ